MIYLLILISQLGYGIKLHENEGKCGSLVFLIDCRSPIGKILADNAKGMKYYVNIFYEKLRVFVPVLL